MGSFRAAAAPVILALLLAQGSPEYPPGLFEHSPVFPDSTPAARHKPPQHHAHGEKCHHYGTWNYPVPQPC